LKSLGTTRGDIGFFTDGENPGRETVLLDIKLVRENATIVRESLRKRGVPDKLDQVDLLLMLYTGWRRLQAVAYLFRRRRSESRC